MIFTKQKLKEHSDLTIKRMDLIDNKYSIDELEAFIDNNELTYNDWCNISVYQILTETFIEKYSDKIQWYITSAYQILSEAFIDKHSDRVNWYNISYNQILSEPIIEKYKDKVVWHYIMLYQKLSYEFMEKHLYRYNLYAC